MLVTFSNEAANSHCFFSSAVLQIPIPNQSQVICSVPNQCDYIQVLPWHTYSRIFLIFLSFFAPLKWAPHSKSSCSVVLHQRAIKHNMTPQDNSPNTDMNSALNLHSSLSCFSSIIFSPIGGNAFLAPFKWMGFWNQSHPAQVTLHQRVTKFKFIAQTHSPNPHFHPSRATVVFFFCTAAQSHSFSCHNALLVNY